MAATDAGTLLFTDDVTADSSSRINAEVYRKTSCLLKKMLIGRRFIMQQDNDPKDTAIATKFFQAKKWNVFDWPSQSTDISKSKLHA